MLKVDLRFTVYWLLLLFSLPLKTDAQLSDAERSARARELVQLRQRIEKVVSERRAVHSRYAQVQKSLRQTEEAISRHVRKLKTLNARLRRKQRELGRLRQQQQKLRKAVSRQRDLLGRQIRAAYMIGRQEYLKLLLNQQDPGALGRVITYYDYFNRARQSRISAALETLTKLETVTRQIREERRKLAALKEGQLAQKRQLEKSNQQRARVMAALKRELASRDEQIKHLRDNEAQLNRLLEAIEDILTAPDRHRRFAEKRGRLPWPVKGKVRNLFGQARHKGRLKWSGALIQAREGARVHAVARGRVAYADWLRGYGLLLIIDHGDGYMSLYAHNQSLLKEVGDWVEADEPIASVGKSGGQRRSALYFEIRYNGQPTNPAQWCGRPRRSG